ncbi:MAG TPA: hypothetical protein VFA16_01860 [Mycobacterium sp.]|uniref:hypothetical protein n=1 Tax=Mycobacterium sp. TaxID=1785 RepID=UPI002D4C1B6F|nr:hypothetical protein [Mycobacterium sp.]HZU45994.1 hypothetical protein [Mycobacterium sp.]
MFSVDYPLQDNFAAMEFLKHCEVSPDDKERFAHRTAESLLRLGRSIFANGGYTTR